MSGALPPIVISAYAASPAYARWDPALETELFRRLSELPGFGGFEVPWRGAVHPHDPEWFGHHLPEGAPLVFTGLPHVMQRLSVDPRYGLASPDDAGRQAALSDLRAQAEDLRQLHARTGIRIAAAMLHSGPRGEGDAAALAASLRELHEWDWAGAELLLEHCDAAVPGQAWEKGFLSLEEELRAIADAATPTGVWMNWGRSAIELRDPDAVAAQIATAAGSGRLRGVAFSGAAAEDGPYGTAWADAHLPIATTDPAAGSLLDVPRIAAALEAAGPLGLLGLKISRRPQDRTAREVGETVRANLDALTQARSLGSA
ncbi:DUF4862 family protein [Microbacterium stercoris]|uniref:DUF4862 family protein n=1 Tax=Microbacterium stercoris TaxID=2820289 RepID=A0A939QNX6_9MICO|nr:DUF4862 family protein [Microbacterium stercoris]MBO3661991.1 DUF4862 family protein [Microbacterium stercoris]